MNPDLTNSTSQVNDPAAHFGQPGKITWLSLPSSFQASRYQLSHLRAPPPPYVSAAPPPYVNAAPHPYVSAAPPRAITPRPYVSAAPRPYVSAAPHPYVSAAPRPYVSAAPHPYVSAATAITNAPQVPLVYSKAAAVSQAQRTAASKNSMPSSTASSQQASSREQTFVVGPAFSLADSLEGGHNLQIVDVTQTSSNDSHQCAPVISNMQTLSPDDFNANSVSISGPKATTPKVSTQERQICIGSVFSLADSHIEHDTGQHETENEVNHIAIDNSASQQALQERPALSYAHQQNKTISTEKEYDTISSQFRTTLFTKQNQYSALRSALNTPVHLTSPPGSSSNNTHETNILLNPITTSKNSVSVEVSSPKDDSQLLDCGVSKSTSHQWSTSAVTSIKDAQLPGSQKNGSIIMETEKKTPDVLRGEETHEKAASLTKPQDNSSTSQMPPHACRDQEPEIVDLDIEDIDDCMLVKIDLSGHHFPYGSKIHNSEVVIDDSDNDEDVSSVSSGETSSEKCGEQKSSASSTVAVGENDPCGTTGSLSMEVEEINTEASKTNSKQTAATYTMSSTGQTHVASVISTGTKTQPLSHQINSEGSCSTWSTSEIENPESELMDLHVDDDECDDAPPSTVEYVSLKVLTPSQPDKNVSTPVIQSMFSSSSLLSSTSDIPVVKESNCNPFLVPAVQGQIIEHMLRGSEVPLLFSHEDVRKGHVSQAIDSSKVVPTVGVPRHVSHNLQSNSATEIITNSKRSHKASLKGKAIKSTTPAPGGKAIKSTTLAPGGKAITSTTPRPKGKSTKSPTLKIKIPSAARTQKNPPSHSDVNSTTVESTLKSTETDSVMCKLCFMFFSSRMELVTHTWNWHRSSQFVENTLKCDDCGKCFANNSLLKLHKKVNCTSSNTTQVDTGNVVVSLDSILHTLLKQNQVSGTPQVSSSSNTFRGGVEPQPSTAGLSSSGAAIDISNSTHVEVSSVVNSFPQRNEVISNYSAGVVTEAATGKHPDFAAGEKPMSEELIQVDIKPIITSSGEILQRTHGPDQILTGGDPSVSDSHKCSTCQNVFSNSYQLLLHQQVSEGCKAARNDCLWCFACAKTFTSSIIRYLHVLNNPECKEKVDRYCNKCSHLFNSLADKQDHLLEFEACRLYEECAMKDIVKGPLAKSVGHVEQNVKEPGTQLQAAFTTCDISEPDKSPALAQENNNSTQVTDSSIPNSVSHQVSMPDSDILQQHSQVNPAGKPKGGQAIKQKPHIKVKPSAVCPACKKKFATSAILILHFNESPKCRMKICSPSKVAKKISASEVAKKISPSEVTKKISPSEVTKKISASKVTKKISASDRMNVPKPVSTPKSPGRPSTSNVIKSSSAAVTASRNVFCDISSTDRSLKCKVCGAEFISENELAHHTEHKCRKLQNTKPVPQLKDLKIVLRRVSVVCQVCHLTFADDTRLAEHLHLNQPCQKGTSERAKKVLDLKKSHLDSETFKRDGKKRSCEIVTGISNVTSTISMASTKDGCIRLAEQIPAMDHVINEKLAKGNDGIISSNSSAKKQYVYDQGNADGESKGRADDSGKDELISMSSSDDGSDMEESGSGSGNSSEEGNRDYTCKQCCKTYASKSLLIKHNKSHHHSARSKKTQCKVCTRKFHDLTGLQAHLLQFKFCFIPLTRPLWERKPDPQICSMCKKVLGSTKDLRKHCFKKMACRLRYVNMVLKNMKEKDNANVPPAVEAEISVLKIVKEKDNANVPPAVEAEISVFKTVKEKDNAKVVPAAEVELSVSKPAKENCESQSANEVSSSVQGYCNPVEVDSSNSDVDFEDESSCIKISQVVSKPLIECVNCSGVFDDFQEHLLKQQACLDFFGIHGNKCPVPVSFCYQCKTHFDDTGVLQLHACKGFIAYTRVCQTCGLKFTNAQNLHAHFQQSLTCNKANLSSPKNNHDSDRTFVDSSAKNQQGEMFASSAVRDVPSSSGEQFFHCLICDARFVTLRLLMEHSYQHVEETPISCDRCSITFLHYNQFVSHQAFHIRMDKEANILMERPQLSTFGASTSADKNMKAYVGSTDTDNNTRAQNSDTMTNNASACIFCHQEFGSVKAKLSHLTSDYACLAIMRYIIENKLFINDQGDTEPFERRVTDSNRCEFCNQSFSDKFYHYLNSACFGRLELAILKYRSSPHPTQHKEITAVSQTERKETDTHVLMKHQGEQQLSGEASPSKDPTSSTSEFPEEACCLKCGRCFRTMIEVNKHQSLWGHKQLLPRSVMESADWQLLKCRVCDLKYMWRHTLINHMVNKHANKVSVLFHELGDTSAYCSLCNKKVMSSSMQYHFEQHKKKFVTEVKEKSHLPLLTRSVELCIICNKAYPSRKYLLEHLKRHTLADMFTPQASKASPVLNSTKCSVGSSLKHEKYQSSGSTVGSAAISNKAGSCKLCGKQFTHTRYYYRHFKRAHKEYDLHSRKEWFMPLVDLKQECSPTKTVARSDKLKRAFQKYRCKLCSRAFIHCNSFVNHFRLSHEDIDPERWEEFMEKCKVTELLKENDDFEMQSSEHVSAILKSCGKPKLSETGFASEIVKSRPKIVSCKVCNKEFSALRFFKVHFKHAHKNYNVANWEDVFNVIGTAYPNSTNTEAAESFKCRPSASETLKLKHASGDSKSKNDDSAASDSDVQNDSLPSVSKKTALFQPLGSCKLCHKQFTNLSFFKFHLKKSHFRFAPEDQKNLFKACTPSHHGEGFKNSGSEDSASLTSVKSQKQKISYPIKSKAISFSSVKILLRVCRVCGATFRDVSSYQVHLRTHLNPCSIKLEDIHSQLIPNMLGITQNCVDIQLQIEGGADKDIVIIDGQSEDGCLYPDSTTSEDAKSVQTRILDERYDSQGMATPAEYGSCLELSTQEQLTNSADDGDFTHTERPKTNHSDSGLSTTSDKNDCVISSEFGLSTTSDKNDCMISSESGLSTTSDKNDCVISSESGLSTTSDKNDCVISSKSGLSTTSDQNDCVIRSESGSLDMFSDDENDDMSNKDNRSEMAGSTFGDIVHTIVDTFFGDCLTDHSHGMSEVEMVSVTENSSTEPQLNLISPNVTNIGLKRKAHEAGLHQEQCSKIKRRSLSQETFCKDQMTHDSSHVSESDNCEMKTAHEVVPDEGQNSKPREHAISCETLQMGDSVGVEEQAINEPSHNTENTCEMEKVDEVDSDQLQSLDNQCCEMSCETQVSTDVCVDYSVSCVDDPVSSADNLNIDKPSVKEDWDKQASEIDKDNGKSSELSESNLMHDTFSLNSSLYNDNVIDKISDVASGDCCEKMKNFQHQRNQTPVEALPKVSTSEMAGSTFGDIVHTIVDTLLGDSLTDHSHGMSEVETVSVTENSSTEPQLNLISPNVTNLGLKRKAHEAGLDREQCSTIKRHNLFQETFCKDQMTQYSSHVSGSDNCEMKTAHEVVPDEGQNSKPQEHAISCETIQLSDSVGVEEQTINEPSHISDNTCEMGKVDEVDSDQLQIVENQCCEMSCETQVSTDVCVDDPVSCVDDPVSCLDDPASCVDDPVSGVNDPVSGVDDPVSCVDDPVSCADNLNIDKPSDKEDWDKKTSEIDKDNGESSELSESNLMHDTFSLNSSLYNDNVIDKISDVASGDCCEKIKNFEHQGSQTPVEALPFRNSLCGEEQAVNKSATIVESGCDALGTTDAGEHKSVVM